MKTYPKQYRLNQADLYRIEAIQEHLKKTYNDETITATDAIKWAIMKACPRVIIEEGA